MQSFEPESVGLSSARLERLKPVMQGYVDLWHLCRDRYAHRPPGTGGAPAGFWLPGTRQPAPHDNR